MIPSGVVSEVREAFDRCRQRYPAIDLAFEVFLARIDETVSSQSGSSADSDNWLACFGKIHHEDLFLATACARQHRIAWEYFVDDYLTIIRNFALKACRNFHEGEELAQQIVTAFLEDRSKVGGYNGRAALTTWLRVAVAHSAIDRFRRASKEISLDELRETGTSAEPKSAGSAQPEDRLDVRWGPVLCGILATAIRRLPARDRLLLALYYLESVPLRLIGRQFQVHEATASRWLDGLRRNLRKSIERELRVRHGLKLHEIESLWVWASEVEGFSLEEALRKG
jgi:RNA polymerase sigma-70 factor